MTDESKHLLDLIEKEAEGHSLEYVQLVAFKYIERAEGRLKGAWIDPGQVATLQLLSKLRSWAKGKTTRKECLDLFFRIRYIAEECGPLTSSYCRHYFLMAVYEMGCLVCGTTDGEGNIIPRWIDPPLSLLTIAKGVATLAGMIYHYPANEEFGNGAVDEVAYRDELVWQLSVLRGQGMECPRPGRRLRLSPLAQ